MSNSILENSQWTEKDFDTMQWHDCKIYAIAFDEKKDELLFDIDYILEWIEPENNEPYFKFRVAPATLIFRNVYDVNLRLQSLMVQIEGISRENPVRPKNANAIGEDVEYDWSIETTSGHINFKSVGYRQVLQSQPKIQDHQQIERVSLFYDASK
jgi:hypothetical protein